MTYEYAKIEFDWKSGEKLKIMWTQWTENVPYHWKKKIRIQKYVEKEVI